MLHRPGVFLLLLAQIFSAFGGKNAVAQTPGIISGIVVDSATGEVLPFPTILIPGTQAGVVGDEDGRFLLRVPSHAADDSTEATAPDTVRLAASYMGYVSDTLLWIAGISEDTFRIHLSPREGTAIAEVVVHPPYEKIRRILEKAIDARDRHDPAKRTYYTAGVYNKLAADGQILLLRKRRGLDTAKARRAAESRHLLVAETYTLRRFRTPGRLQEDVLASRLSGFPTSDFALAITDALPFGTAQPYMVLNGREYPNPVAPGWAGRYTVGIRDEVATPDGDTVWILSFRPKRGHGVRGQIEINSAGYAVQRLVTEVRDSALGHVTRLEQVAARVDGKWFPSGLRYGVDWKATAITGPVHVEGYARVDSVSFAPVADEVFDKAHSVRVMLGAERLPDSAWTALRPENLSAKEAGTYTYTDSLFHATHLDFLLARVNKLYVGLLPVGPVEIDLPRLVAFSSYERIRLGLGLQTSDSFSRRFRVGGWAGYGFEDARWKGGGFAEVAVGRYYETRFRIAYNRDVRDPGRVLVHPQLDLGYLRQLLLGRVDFSESWTASLRGRKGGLSTEVTARIEKLQPQYTYYFNPTDYGAQPGNIFFVREASVSLRYAVRERSVPLLGQYSNLGTDHPVFYGRVTSGEVHTGGFSTPATRYVQLTAAVAWQRHLLGFGRERVLVSAGQSFADGALPLSKLFAGRGFRSDVYPLYIFGGLVTAVPYQYYTDRFASLSVRHDFDWRIFSAKVSAPYPAVAYNGLVGTLAHREYHSGAEFSVPARAHHEAGILLNDLARVKVGAFARLTATAGYFVHLTDAVMLKEDGAVVVGFGVEF